jgi:hypothetical protein
MSKQLVARLTAGSGVGRATGFELTRDQGSMNHQRRPANQQSASRDRSSRPHGRLGLRARGATAARHGEPGTR